MVLSNSTKLLCLVSLFIAMSSGVDRSKFKSCEQSAFCRRTRRRADAEQINELGNWIADPRRLQRDEASGSLIIGLHDPQSESEMAGFGDFSLQIVHIAGGVFRLTVNELNPLRPRYVPRDVLLEPLPARPFRYEEFDGGLVLKGDGTSVLKVHYKPLLLELFREGDLVISVNSRGLLHHEKQRENPSLSRRIAANDNAEQQLYNAETEAVPDDDDEVLDTETVNNDGQNEEEEEVHAERIDDGGDLEGGFTEDEAIGVYTGAEVVEEKEEEEERDPAEIERERQERADGIFSETFGEHADSKPYGPSAVSFDARFHGSQHLYGIPEHADSFQLRPTRGDGISRDPYRLYNLDVFEYELEETMALYASLPVMVSHSRNHTVGLMWLNAAEMWIDIEKCKEPEPGIFSRLFGGASKVSSEQIHSDTHWIAESGLIDIFLIPGGPSPHDFFHQYSLLSGTPELPPTFAISYHQCRWNYRDEADVDDVTAGFDEHEIPFDVLWLDIEHTNGKRYFTWDEHKFPEPKAMLERVWKSGHRRMVTIVDPHVKRDNDYSVHSEALERDLYVKTKDKEVYDGWCWPGSSSWPDFTRADVREWWADLFAYDKYVGSSPTLFIWNDMNEMSVFNGPEVTMLKDARHGAQAEWEHRDVHNLYGYYHHMATREGLIKRDPDRNRRPFVLSRAAFIGTQRVGPIWTGDNKADWTHLAASVPMLLSLSVAGLSFAGADVGGFFGNPDAELVTRWYQAGAFQPFFRGHAHLDTKRREPWLFGEPWTSYIRSAIRARYSFLPYWSTLFAEAHRTGVPVMRPLWVEFAVLQVLTACADDEKTWSAETCHMVGNALLVCPVTQAQQSSVSFYLPAGRWYDLHDFVEHVGGQSLSVLAPIDKIPVLQRGGTIVPKRERARRSSGAMINDPYTLYVALDTAGNARGELYIDDGETFNYQHESGFLRQMFEFSKEELALKSSVVDGSYPVSQRIERIVLVGAANLQIRSSKVQLPQGEPRELQFSVDHGANHLVIRNPDLPLGDHWVIHFFE